MDIALQYGQRSERREYCVLLFAEQVFPVCIPALVAGDHPLDTPSELRHLLHDTMSDVTWPIWLRAASAVDAEASSGPAFSHSVRTVDAALAEEDIALGRSPLVADDLASSRVVRPFETALVANWGYYVIYLPDRALEPKIRAFRDWVLHEARLSEAITLLGAQP